MTPVAGIVLAAGAGRRMGGPKALLRAHPSAPAFVEVALERVRDAGCDPVLVVVGAAAEQVRAALPDGTASVECRDWREGMGASLRAGLRWMIARPAPPPAVLVCLVDLPDVPASVHRRVLDAGAGEGRSALVRAAYGGLPGHPVLLGAGHWDGILEQAHGDRGARDYLAAHPPVLVECADLATGRDVDTPEDLRG